MSGRHVRGAGDLREPFVPQRAPDFDITSVAHDDEVIVAVRGEVDLATAPLLERELSLEPVRDARAVLIDLEQVVFMDLTGLRPLLAFAVPARPGHRVAITAGSPPVQRLLELSGLRRHFTVVAPHWP
jgi:anti-sigma B factor antagonist